MKNSKQQAEDKDLAKPETPPEITLDGVVDTLSLTIKNDYENKLLTFLGMLSAYTDSSQLNVSFNAPSSSGKTYITTEIAKLFPDDDKIERSSASPTSFFHAEGKEGKRGNTKVKIVSLERKILLFYEQPNPELQKRLRAVLSHDQRELKYSITNKIKGTNRAEQIIVRGYPATVFCSAGLRLDEQEATRAILLSPQITEDKLKEGVHLQAVRGADERKFEDWLESQPERIALKQRIIDIRSEHVDDIIIKDPEIIEQRFSEMFGKPKPRHMRDMGHLIQLIKVVTLLNVWYRRQSDGTIVANQEDVDNGFNLWNNVFVSQDLNIPPVVLDFYKSYILSVYLEKSKNPEFIEAIEAKKIGVTRSDISAKYLKLERTMLNDEQLRKQFLPQLENSGLITQEKPSFGVADRRSMHIYPQWFPEKNDPKDQNNIGEGGGFDSNLEDILKDW